MSYAASVPMPARVSHGAKVIGAGVIAKAVLMGVLVTVLAVEPFLESLALVLVSACATGIFGLVIVLVQVHAERELHGRMDRLEERGQRIESKADTAAIAADTAAATAGTIAKAVGADPPEASS